MVSAKNEDINGPHIQQTRKFFEQVWTGRQLTTVILNRHVEFVEAYKIMRSERLENLRLTGKKRRNADNMTSTGEASVIVLFVYRGRLN